MSQLSSGPKILKLQSKNNTKLPCSNEVAGISMKSYEVGDGRHYLNANVQKVLIKTKEETFN